VTNHAAAAARRAADPRFVCCVLLIALCAASRQQPEHALPRGPDVSRPCRRPLDLGATIVKAS
jgi:hypothetical protein